MGGLGPGIGGFELVLIALIALIVVGPKDLPLMMRKVGQFMGKARQMASEFRASFDEMARQSELDELRKEVESLRSGQMMHKLGPDAEAAFKDIQQDLTRPTTLAKAPAPALETPEGDTAPVSGEPKAIAAPEPAPAAKATPKPRKRAAPKAKLDAAAKAPKTPVKPVRKARRANAASPVKPVRKAPRASAA